MSGQDKELEVSWTLSLMTGDYCNLGENYEIFYLLLSRYYRQYNVEKVLLLMSDEINL